MGIERIMVVDDDVLSGNYLAEALTRDGFTVDKTCDGQKAISMINNCNYDLMFIDMKMPGISGLDVLEKTKKISKETTAVIMTAYGSIESAVEAMKNGAYDYIIKPFSLDQIEILLKRVQERQKLIDETKYWRTRSNGNEDYDIITNKHSKMNSIFKNINRLARSKASVLIQGESGTGKELVAHSIYLHSQRNSKPFIKVNCAALSENLLESELFGHEKGAFTSADAKRIGRFELANGGTLLLDEISEISPKIQAKLLRVLEQEEFERVGGSKTLKVDVRVISTTNRNIPLEIEKGSFRQDLYFRLNVIPVIVPPLRERKEDIPDLVEHFFNKYKSGIDTPLQSISKETMNLLTQYDWYGNVRELKNLIHRCIVMVDAEVLLPEHIENMLNVPVRSCLVGSPPVGRTGQATGGNAVRKNNELSVGQTIDEVEKELIYKTLENTDGNKTRAAEILDITPRTLRNKLSKYKSSQFNYKAIPDIEEEKRVVVESFS